MKTFIIFIFTIVIVSISSAQDTKWSATIAGQVTNLSQSTVFFPKNNSGFKTTVVPEIGIHKKIGQWNSLIFRSGLSYSMLGGKNAISNDSYKFHGLQLQLESSLNLASGFNIGLGVLLRRTFINSIDGSQSSIVKDDNLQVGTRIQIEQELSSRLNMFCGYTTYFGQTFSLPSPFGGGIDFFSSSLGLGLRFKF